MTNQPPLTPEEHRKIYSIEAFLNSHHVKVFHWIAEDLKAARAEIERVSDERDLWINAACQHREELDALTSYVASSQPRDGYVVLEVPREVWECQLAEYRGYVGELDEQKIARLEERIRKWKLLLDQPPNPEAWPAPHLKVVDPPTVGQSVWVVRYSNYEPAEISDIYATSELAHAACDQLDGEWLVEEWPIISRKEEPHGP